MSWCPQHGERPPCKHGVAWAAFCAACEDELDRCTCPLSCPRCGLPTWNGLHADGHTDCHLRDGVPTNSEVDQ